MKLEKVFDYEKATKNTIRYKEVTDGQPPLIGTVYIQKWGLTGTPKKIKMTIEVEEE